MATLTLLLRNFIKLVVPNKLRELDQHLLTHHPLVWETRVHWFTFYTLFLLIGLIGLGCCVPISFPNGIQGLYEISASMAIVRGLTLAIVLVLFSLLVNGSFAKIFKIGFILTNQKYRALDFFKLAGIYSFMVLLGIAATSAFHYTVLFRTHSVIGEKANYAVLEKYVKVYEFYQQDTLKIKGFESIKEYIEPKMINYSRVSYGNTYFKTFNGNEEDYSFNETTDKNIKNWTVEDRRNIPINKALYDILPTDLRYATGPYEAGAVKQQNSARLLAARKIRLDPIIFEESINKYTSYQPVKTPHTVVSTLKTYFTIGKDSCWYNAIDKKIIPDYYASVDKYSNFRIEESLLIFIAPLFLVLLFLSLHAVKSYRYFSLMPISIGFSVFFLDAFMHYRYVGHGDSFEQSMLLFYLFCIVGLPFFHQKVSITNPFRLALTYMVGSIIFVSIYSHISNYTPYLPFLHEKNTIIITTFIIYGLLHLALLLFRNTRFAVSAPFVYFMVFIWPFLLTPPYPVNSSSQDYTENINVFTSFLYDHSLAIFTSFCILNLVSACFVLPAIVRETAKPQP